MQKMTRQQLLWIALAGGGVVLLAGGAFAVYKYRISAAGAPYLAPTLEARDAAGRWHLVAPEFGYPAGMPRRMTFPLSRLPVMTRSRSRRAPTSAALPLRGRPQSSFCPACII